MDYNRSSACRDCGMVFPSNGLLQKHRNQSCLERPSYQALEDKSKMHATRAQITDDRVRKQKDLEHIYHRNTTETQNELGRLRRERQRVEAELMGVHKAMQLHKEAKSLQRKNALAKQRDQNDLLLLKLQHSKSEEYPLAKSSNIDEEMLLKIQKLKRSCLAGGGDNTDMLMQIGNLERQVIEKALKYNKQQKQKTTAEKTESMQKPASEKTDSKEVAHATDLTAHLMRLEQDNERLKREFERLQNMNATFLQQQQTMMFQRDVLNILERSNPPISRPARQSPPPAMAPPVHQPESRDLIMNYESEIERLRTRLEKVELLLKEKNQSQAGEPLAFLASTSPTRPMVAPLDSVAQDPVTRLADSPTLNEQQRGFRIYFDFVGPLTAEIGSITLKYWFCIDGFPSDVPFELSSTSFTHMPHSGQELVFTINAHQNVPNSTPDPESSLLLELTTVDKWGMTSDIVWNMIDLYKGSSYRDLQQGKWKIVMLKPPVQPQLSKIERYSMKNLSSTHIYLRVESIQNEDEPANDAELEDASKYKPLLAQS